MRRKLTAPIRTVIGAMVARIRPLGLFVIEVAGCMHCYQGIGAGIMIDLASDKESSSRLLTRVEAASYLRISIRTLDSLKSVGDIVFVRIGGRVAFDKRDLDEYIEQCKSQSDGDLIDRILVERPRSG